MSALVDDYAAPSCTATATLHHRYRDLVTGQVTHSDTETITCTRPPGHRGDHHDEVGQWEWADPAPSVDRAAKWRKSRGGRW